MNQIGIICEVRGAVASVQLDDELRTAFLPVVQASSNSNSVSFAPPRLGEQVLVIAVNDDINAGVILRGLYQNAHELQPEESVEKVEFSDGTKMSYDTATSTLKITSAAHVVISCNDADITASAHVNLSCESAKVKASGVTVDSPSIDLGTGGAGVVTGACICHFTGLPHGDISANTRSAK